MVIDEEPAGELSTNPSTDVPPAEGSFHLEETNTNDETIPLHAHDMLTEDVTGTSTNFYPTSMSSEMQTLDLDDHLSRLVRHCRIAMDQAKIKRPVSNSDEFNQYHVLANGETVSRCTETLHLPGGGFYTRFYYKVMKTPC